MDQKDFLEKLKKLQEKEGVSMEAFINLKQDVADGITKREQALVEHIVKTYLNANFQINENEPKPKPEQKSK